MGVRKKSIRFGCILAASLIVLLLAGCDDASESGSSQTAQPPKKSPPTKTAESHATGGRPASCKPTQPDMLGPFYEPDARASGRSSRRGQRWVRLTCRVGCYGMMAGQKGGKVGRWVCSSRT
jgi:hypothetical protein